MKIVLLLIVNFICFVALGQIQNLLPKQLSIFKNGSYFLSKTSELTVKNKKIIIAAPNNVMMGGFWLSVGNNTSLQAITIKRDTISIKKTAYEIEDYYKALLGKQITLKEGYFSNDTTLIGQLLEFNENKNIIKIKKPNGKIVIKKIDLDSRLEFDAKENLDFNDKNIEDIAEIKVNDNVNNTLVNTISLHSGIQWVPSYLLKINNNNEATLTLKATIINGKEHFINTNVDIVIGNPEMFYGSQADPLALAYIKSLPMSSMATQSYLNINTNYGLNGSYNNDDDEEKEEVYEPEFDEKKGNKLEDLYFFQLGNIELEPNSRVIVPIKTINVTYEDVYTCTLPVNSTSTKVDFKPEVVHKYNISNKSDIPLTTGPVLVLNKDELPIAQTELKYTAIGGKQGIKLSNAIDVSIGNEETEIKRNENAKKIKNGEQFDLVYYEGKINIRNLQNKKIKLLLNKNLLGNVEVASKSGTIKKRKGYQNKENSFSEISWEIELQPNENVDLTYKYNSFE
jgi:hypothetical protein